MYKYFSKLLTRVKVVNLTYVRRVQCQEGVMKPMILTMSLTVTERLVLQDQ